MPLDHALSDGSYPQQVWCAFNHFPNGQIMIQHFDDYELEKRGREDTTSIIKFECHDQMKNFSKSPMVQLNINGKIEKNKVLVYEGEPRDLRGKPRAANIVLAWAIKQGLLPIHSDEEKKKMKGEDRLSLVEMQNLQLRQQLDAVMTILSTRETTKQEIKK